MFDHPRLVIVTGSGGSGCGPAIAARFAADRAAVVVSDINEVGGHETVRLIEQRGGLVAFCRADVADELMAASQMSTRTARPVTATVAITLITSSSQ
jgi:NAD(P)-dependent dehydrogenase (short-subunit alcohol dehydrogenase family)